MTMQGPMQGQGTMPPQGGGPQVGAFAGEGRRRNRERGLLSVKVARLRG